jgi:transcriptional regulator
MESKLITGAVDMLILEVTSHEPTYGYAITQEVLSRSAGRFELKEGSLYPALHRLERQKLIKATWSEVEGRKRKYYQITAAGAKILAAKRKEWQEFSQGINGVLGLNFGMA